MKVLHILIFATLKLPKVLSYLIWDIYKSDIACNTTTLRENELNRIIQKFWLFPVQNIKVKSEIKMTKWQKNVYL